MLTVEKLNAMEPELDFAKGVTQNPVLHKDPVRWVAVRGIKHDWAIYYHLATKLYSFVMTNGDKCKTKEVIRDLVPCDDEAMKLYRY
jgi:hypothetical protein